MGSNTRDGGGEHTVDHEKEGGANDDWTVPEGDKWKTARNPSPNDDDDDDDDNNDVLNEE
eukprot:CAMPEP_0202448260 /NCGR_PEP_ID=MMETSP1360-20130828/7080_1 /ASSEMBLY_ACC=CAM_ASM_000848 /TAXON_ID=515479 /ORGANISM="Licmophora paradoxa, Strain CCMP2313" /LENGTH=59 /DNA_ID=CAMNT_0049065761 /DNA_START=505 /DNA_END=682 /DNA_ORIENTATION=-